MVMILDNYYNNTGGGTKIIMDNNPLSYNIKN